jgi:hypothetical protein
MSKLTEAARAVGRQLWLAEKVRRKVRLAWSRGEAKARVYHRYPCRARCTCARPTYPRLKFLELGGYGLEHEPECAIHRDCSCTPRVRVDMP